MFCQSFPAFIRWDDRSLLDGPSQIIARHFISHIIDRTFIGHHQLSIVQLIGIYHIEQNVIIADWLPFMPNAASLHLRGGRSADIHVVEPGTLLRSLNLSLIHI